MITVKCRADNNVLGVSMDTFKDLKEGDVIELVHENGRSIRLVTVSDVGEPCSPCYFLTTNDKCPHTEAGTLMCALFPYTHCMVKAEDII